MFVDSPSLLRSTINLIFDKATSEEKFCPLYALMCKQLQVSYILRPRTRSSSLVLEIDSN
jgi:hypothetical protein